MSIPQPDIAVIRRAQRGDERAFTLLVRTYEAPIFNYVLHMIGDRTLAEDLTQDVFLRVYRGLRGYSSRAQFTTWLFQVARNRVVDELRAAERRPRSLLAIEDAPQLEAVDAPIEQSEAIEVLLHAVDGLSPDLKEALLLRDIAGLSYNEIADTLEVTLATVKWRIFKAREEVQQALEEQGVELSTHGESASSDAGSTD
jgi:RNA polymerase sigma-70 factor (ECF subfamily)